MNTAATQLPASSSRIESIDLLRGIVMIIMALDHVRDYFHADAFLFDPLDPEKTSIILYFTRWITHFCAPVFVFLAGTSAFLVGTRKGKKELSMFLLKRGVWLIILEFTIINFAWFFNIHFPNLFMTVIWVLGMAMIVLAGAIHLPFKGILALGIVLVAGHNLLDPVHIEGTSAASALWTILHAFGAFKLTDSLSVFVGYPLIPWAGVMLLGYCFGSLYLPAVNPDYRKKILVYLGVSALVLFIVLRAVNIYGDLKPWVAQSSALATFFSFMNVTKYPPSLLYVLVTLGTAMLVLATTEKFRGKSAQKIIALGRVPMFYYIVHLYLIHIVALFAALATGFTVSDMTFDTWITNSPNLKGYGFSLGVVYIVWIGIVVALFPLCLWYDKYKRSHRDQWWLSYL